MLTDEMQPAHVIKEPVVVISLTDTILLCDYSHIEVESEVDEAVENCCEGGRKPLRPADGSQTRGE
jgi:hypothetical protein